MAAELTLELVAHGAEQTITLPIAAHVKKYTERFIYTDRIDGTSVPIVYYESDPATSWRNLQIVDKTHLIPANTEDLVISRSTWTEVTSISFTSSYKEVSITDRVAVDKAGNRRPLFSCHRLPEKTVEVNINVIQNGVISEIEEGYFADIENNIIYTNYKNIYNYDDGSYILYFVSSVDEDGNATQTLLSPEPVAREATWKDVDLTTGALKKDVPLYSKSKTSGGYTYQMNKSGTYYVRVVENSLIKPRRPAGIDPDEEWNIRFTAGEFATYVNGRFRRYWLPEYASQPYQPAYPYVYAPYRRLLWVNRNTLKSSKEEIYISPEEDMHLFIYVYDEDDVLRGIFTTDGSLEGQRYVSSSSELTIKYQSGLISSWDNVGGFINLGIEVDPNWTYYATHFYKANDYEFKGKSLNPLQDRSVLDYMWVYYMIPDADNNDKAIHLMSVDRSGIICSTTQIKGRSYPNLTLYNEDGTVNPNTVIGTKYRSAVSTDTFIQNYTAQWDNDYGYYVLAEVLPMDVGIKEESLVVDVAREGATFSDEGFEAAIKANPRILQSSHGFGEDGQEVPVGGSYIIHYPATILGEYGGEMTKSQAETALREFLPSYTYPVMLLDHPESLLEGSSTTTGQVDLKISWEGPKYSYRLYRKQDAGAEWSLYRTVAAKLKTAVGSWPAEGAIYFTEVDSSVESGKIYYYSVRLYDGRTEFPFSDVLSVKVM